MYLRGAENVNGYPMPLHRQSKPGIKFSQIVSSLNYLKTIWPYATHIHFQTGVNDIYNGATFTQLKANATAAYSAARAVIGPYGKRLKVSQSLITPVTTSTDSWKTAANQTYYSGFEPGGYRDQFNNWVIAGADGLLDGYMPVTELEDSTDHNKWKSNGSTPYGWTAEGVHPSAMVHQTMTAPNILYSSWTA